jgi:WD40 repeat protein
MTKPIPAGQPGTTISVPFVPSVLAWSDDGTHILAGGNSTAFNYGTAGLAVIDTTTGAVAWHLDGRQCAAAQIAGPLVAICLESQLEVHDLLHGSQTWQPCDLGLSGTSRLSVDPSGHRIAVSTGSDYALLDLTTGLNLVRIPLQPVLGFRPVISPTGSQAAVADTQGVAICDASTGAILHQVATSSMPLVAEFDETGATVTVVDLDASVTVIDTASGNLVSSSSLTDAHIYAWPSPALVLLTGNPVTLSPDRRVVLVAGSDSNSMYAATTGVRIGTVPAEGTPLAHAAYSPDARAAVVTSAFGKTNSSGTAMLVSAPRPQVLWQRPLTETTAAAFSRTGRLAVAHNPTPPAGMPQPPSSGVILIDVVMNAPLFEVTAGSGGDAAVLGVAVAGAGIRLAAGICADQAARLYAVDGGRLLYERAHPGPLADVVFVRNGQSFATACNDGRVRLFDTVTGEQPWHQQYTGPVNALACPPAGDFICAAGGDKTVRCLDAATGAQRWQAPFPQAVTRVIVSPDGAFAVAACADRTARLLHAADGGQAWQVQHDKRIRGLAVSPDATLVATASEDGIVRVLASGSGAVVREVSHVQGATSVAFSADGQSVISGSLDGAVLASPVADPAAPPAPLIQATAPVRQIGSGPGRSVAVVSDDGLVRVVDLDLRTDLARILSTAPVNDIAIDTTAGLLATGSADGTIRVDTWGSV